MAIGKNQKFQNFHYKRNTVWNIWISYFFTIWSLDDELSTFTTENFTFSRYSHFTNIYLNSVQLESLSYRILKRIFCISYESSTFTEIPWNGISNEEVKTDSIWSFQNSIYQRNSPYSSSRYRKSFVVRFFISCVNLLITITY